MHSSVTKPANNKLLSSLPREHFNLLAPHLAYLIGVFLASPSSVANYLGEDVLDEQPGENSEHGIADEQQEKRRDHPARPPPPET